jgi:hypothetical protein
MAFAAAPSALADSKIRIDTVPATYEPPLSMYAQPLSLGGYHFEANALSMYAQPLSLGGYHFEANEETGRARVVVEYDYHIINPGEYDPGPEPTIAQIPGLTWDAATRSVVYQANGRRTACAVAYQGRHLKLKNTGACTVTTTEGEHTTDDGWSLHHFKAIDVWFEAH